MKKLYFFTIFAFFLATGLTYAQQFELKQEFPGLRKIEAPTDKIAKIVGNQAIYADVERGAYVFEKDETGKWELTATLDGSGIVSYGYSASITEDKAIVGSINTTYIYQKTSSGWQEVAAISADAVLGGGVAISGDYAMIAYAYADNKNIEGGGFVDVFKLTSEGEWVKHQRLVNSNNKTYDRFGVGLVMDGDRAIIGAKGNLYVFDLNKEGQWVETDIITGNCDLNVSRCLTDRIDLYKDIIVIGDPIYNYNTGSANYTGGRAKIYQKTEADWKFVQPIEASNAPLNSYLGFGEILAVGDDILAVQTEGKGTYVYAENPSGNWERTQILQEYYIMDIAGNDAIAITYGPENDAVYFLSKMTASDLAVANVSLVNATTGQKLKTIKDGDRIDLTDYNNENFNIVAEIEGKAGSVKFELLDLGNQNNNFIQRTENKAPYAVFGDKSGDYRNWQPEERSYSLVAIPYAEKNLQGQIGKSLSVSFYIVRSKPQQVTQTANYSMFKTSSIEPEFLLVSAETNEPLQTLKEGDVVNLAKYNTENFNIVAKAFTQSSVELELRLKNALFIRRTENKFPYAVFGDTKASFRNWEPELGEYTLKVGTYRYGFEELRLVTFPEINFRIINEPVAAVAESKTETARLSLYPNPAVYQVNAKVEATQSYQLSVFDKFGQKVYSKTGKGRLEESINLSGHQPGLYMVVLEADGKRESQRLILQ